MTLLSLEQVSSDSARCTGHKARLSLSAGLKTITVTSPFPEEKRRFLTGKAQGEVLPPCFSSRLDVSVARPERFQTSAVQRLTNPPIWPRSTRLPLFKVTFISPLDERIACCITLTTDWTNTKSWPGVFVSEADVGSKERQLTT